MKPNLYTPLKEKARTSRCLRSAGSEVISLVAAQTATLTSSLQVSELLINLNFIHIMLSVPDLFGMSV